MSSVIILQGTTDSFSLQNLATLPDLLMSANRRFFLASKHKDKSVFLTGWSQMFEQKKKKGCIQRFLWRRIDSVFLNFTCYPKRNEANKTAVQAECDRTERRDKLPSFQQKSWDAAHNINLKTNRKKGRKFFLFFLLLFYTAPHLFRNLTLKKHFNMFVLKSNVADLSQALVFRFTGKLNIKIKWYWVPLVNTRPLDRGKRLEQRTD